MIKKIVDARLTRCESHVNERIESYAAHLISTINSLSMEFW